MSSQKRASKNEATTRVLALGLTTSILLTLGISFVSLKFIDDTTFPAAIFPNTPVPAKNSIEISLVAENKSASHTFVDEEPSRRARLVCHKWGGPSDELLTAEMVYWRDIPTDAQYTSPFYNSSAPEKFLFFDADPAGFNNKRISFENFILMAHVMGRTLVMPPKGFWWGFQNENGQENPQMESPRWSFEDFYELDKIHQAGLKIISMEEFIVRFGVTGMLKDKENGAVLFPPNNRTNWDKSWQKVMKNWLKRVTVQIKWRPESCLGAFPAHPFNNSALEEAILVLNKKHVPGPGHWIDNPNPVDSPIIMRMEELLTERTNLCLYDSQLHDEPYLYYKIFYDAGSYETKMVTNIRLLIWFYQFFFFEDWHQDLWSKRFIRDHLRYKDELQCAAARIVAAMREKARKKHNGNGEFHSFHIRRKGEFEEQYGNLTEATDIYKISVKDIPDGSTVYIATDDMNRTFFQPLTDHYDVYFLGDFQELLGDLNYNYYSIIDQLVASRGRVFFGAFCSTFTGFINRMRGYRSQNDKTKGWHDGIIESYFYNYQDMDKRNKMRAYHPPVPLWYGREFPMAWRDIDHDVETFVGVDADHA